MTRDACGGSPARTGPVVPEVVDRRAWRRIFVLYAAALTLGTHWPRLQLHVVDVPAPDRLIHASAFGLGALLLWRTGWVRRLRVLLAIGLAWCALDEISQSIPGLGRQSSLSDAVASMLGVAMAVSLLWSVGPIDEVLAEALALAGGEPLCSDPVSSERFSIAALLARVDHRRLLAHRRAICDEVARATTP